LKINLHAPIKIFAQVGYTLAGCRVISIGQNIQPVEAGGNFVAQASIEVPLR